MRTEPIRNFSNAFRNDDSWDEPEPYEDEEYEHEDWEDVVYRSVQTGYEVTEEEEETYGGASYDQIRYGERAAKGLNDRGYGLGWTGDDFWDMSGRALRWYTEMWNLWLQAMTGGFTPWREPRPAAQCRPPRPGPRPRQRPWRRAAASVEVEARQPVAVEVDLRMPAGGLVTPHVHELRPRDRSDITLYRPPLTHIWFHRGSIPDAIHVHVRIPDNQPPGLYAGPVFDRRTERRLGTMSVRLSGDFVPRPGGGEEPPPDPGPAPEPQQDGDKD